MYIVYEFTNFGNIIGGGARYYPHKLIILILRVIVILKVKKICLEIKLSSSPAVSKGFYQTIEDIKPDYSFVIIPEGEEYPKNEGIWVCSMNIFER